MGIDKPDSYMGNSNVKRDGVTHAFTNAEVAEYIRCINDPAYFARTYCKVINLDEGLVNFDLYPYQEKMFNHFNDNRFSIVLACRQSGKSISSVAYLLWYAITHPETTIAILANKGSTSQEMLGRITLMLENLPFFLQPGCKALNKRSIEFSNNSRIVSAATSGSSIRGMAVNLLYLDEFAFVENAATFYTSTYPVISSGKNTKVIITSTANGVGNTYHKIWEGAVQGTNEFKPFRVDWWDVPGRDEQWKNQTIKNTSQLQFDQEFGNCLENNSQITILVNNMVYDIRIGDLYECIQRGDSSGLSVEEEIRLTAIRWYNYEEKTENSIIDMQILTPTGFQPFDGVKRYWHDKSLEFLFSDGTRIRTSLKHKFIVNNIEKYADELFEGFVLTNNKRIDHISVIRNGEYFYDPVNVSGGSIFYHDNGLTSHNTFFGTGNTLIDAETLMGFRSATPLRVLEDQSVRIYNDPERDHTYIMTVDVAKGRGQDYSTFTIIDISVTPFKQVATYRNNKISPILYPNILHKYARVYNNAYVVIESNDQGAVVCNGLYYELEYEHMHVESLVKSSDLGIEVNKKVKRLGCSNIKDLLEEGRLQIVDGETISEISTFVANGQSYAASDGNHDDLMMNLVLFGYFTNHPAFLELTDVDIKKMLFQQRIDQIENDLLPFGFIDDGSDFMVEQDLKEKYDPWSVNREWIVEYDPYT